MSSSRRVAVVTGANKGIAGYAIIQALCAKFDGDVYLTARSESNAQAALKTLAAEGITPKYHQLDITDQASVDALEAFLQTTYGGLDLLVNNAGFAFKEADITPFEKQAEVCVDINFWGTLNVCKALFPLLRPHARKMASNRRVAIVTGANKGIGYAIIQALCAKFDGDVYLTARSESNAQAALKTLAAEGITPKYHQLDITDQASIDALKAFLQTTYGGLDLLVNNAGFAFKAAATEPFAEQAEVSVDINFTGTLNVCKALFPLLRPHARVVNVSSTGSNYAAKKCSEDLVKRFLSPDLTMSKVEGLMDEFVQDTKDDTYKSKGWPQSAYGTSKIGVTLMSFIQQRELNNDPRADIVVNACCPGYVDTDMSSHKGTKTPAEGADTPVYLALLPPGTTSPKGNFVSDRKIQTWP